MDDSSGVLGRLEEGFFTFHVLIVLRFFFFSSS